MSKNKPPAFQFYVKDWLSSPTVRGMTPAERGLYIDLLAFSWPDGIPAGMVGHMLVGISEQDWACLSPKVLAQFVTTSDARLFHPKLEEQFKNLDSFHKMQRDKAKKGADARWHGSGTERAMPEDASSSSPSIASSTSKASIQTKSEQKTPNEKDKPSDWSQIIQETENELSR